MSLESYKKNLEEQRRRELNGSQEPESTKSAALQESEKPAAENRYEAAENHYAATEDQRATSVNQCAAAEPANPAVEPAATSASKKKSGAGKIIAWVTIIAVVFLAVLKNPSETEAKAEVKSMIMDVVNEKMQDKAAEPEGDIWSQLGAGLAMVLAPSIIDRMVDVEVSDYILFSTFNAKATVIDQEKSVVSGAIIFGKAIPFHSDLKDLDLDL